MCLGLESFSVCFDTQEDRVEEESDYLSSKAEYDRVGCKECQRSNFPTFRTRSPLPLKLS